MGTDTNVWQWLSVQLQHSLSSCDRIVDTATGG